MRTKSIFFQNIKAHVSILLTLLGVGLCNGQEVSERVYSPSGDYGMEAIFQASDGGAWVLFDGSEVLKLDENLDVEWFEVYDLVGTDKLIALAETDDGGIITGGYEGVINIIYTPTPLLTRLSPNGEVVWAKSFDLGYLAYVQSIVKLESEQYLAVLNSTNGRSTFVYFDEDGSSFNFMEPQVNGEDVRTFDCIKRDGGGYLVGGDYYDDGLEKRVIYIAEFLGQSPIWSKTYTYEYQSSPGVRMSLVTTSNSDIGLSSRIADNSTQMLREIILLRLSEAGELKWGKKFVSGNDSYAPTQTGLVADGTNGIRQSFTYPTGVFEIVSHFSGWNEEGDNLFLQTVRKSNIEQSHSYAYRADGGLFVMSSEFREFATNAKAAVLTFQGPQGEMPCDQSSDIVEISELLPEVSDVMLELVPTDGAITDLDVSKQSFNVASYVLCSSTLSTSNLEAERGIKIYPNPTNSTVFFDLSEVEHETTLIQIFDELGREVFRQNGVSANLFSIPKESIGSGFFIARISNSDTGEMVKEGKFVVK